MLARYELGTEERTRGQRGGIRNHVDNRSAFSGKRVFIGGGLEASRDPCSFLAKQLSGSPDRLVSASADNAAAAAQVEACRSVIEAYERCDPISHVPVIHHASNAGRRLCLLEDLATENVLSLIERCRPQRARGARRGDRGTNTPPPPNRAPRRLRTQRASFLNEDTFAETSPSHHNVLSLVLAQSSISAWTCTRTRSPLPSSRTVRRRPAGSRGISQKGSLLNAQHCGCIYHDPLL